jgi:hypothetical protein
MDRGYFAAWLICKLKSLGIDVVCRVGTHLVAVKKMIAENLTVYVDCIKSLLCNYDIKYIRYTVKKENNNGTSENIDYFIATTIMGALDLPITIAELYHDRWKIETHFRLAKYELSLDNIVSKKLLNIKQDILLHLIISIILETCQFFGMLKLPKIYLADIVNSDKFTSTESGTVYSLNKAVLLVLVCEGILPTLIRNTADTNNYLEKAFCIAAKHKCEVREGMHYDRVKKKTYDGFDRGKNSKKKIVTLLFPLMIFFISLTGIAMV